MPGHAVTTATNNHQDNELLVLSFRSDGLWCNAILLHPARAKNSGLNAVAGNLLPIIVLLLFRSLLHLCFQVSTTTVIAGTVSQSTRNINYLAACVSSQLTNPRDKFYNSLREGGGWWMGWLKGVAGEVAVLTAPAWGTTTCVAKKLWHDVVVEFRQSLSFSLLLVKICKV